MTHETETTQIIFSRKIRRKEKFYSSQTVCSKMNKSNPAVPFLPVWFRVLVYK